LCYDQSALHVFVSCLTDARQICAVSKLDSTIIAIHHISMQYEVQTPSEHRQSASETTDAVMVRHSSQGSPQTIRQPRLTPRAISASAPAAKQKRTLRHSIVPSSASTRSNGKLVWTLVEACEANKLSEMAPSTSFPSLNP